MNDIDLDNDLARVVDLLEQIREVNKMIALHRDKSGNALMGRQYEEIKERFLAELKEVLAGFDVEVSFKKKAA